MQHQHASRAHDRRATTPLWGGRAIQLRLREVTGVRDLFFERSDDLARFQNVDFIVSDTEQT